MVIPTAEEIEERIFKDGLLELPKSIRVGINKCLKSSPSEIEEASSYLSNAYKKDYWNPPDVRYETEATIDAYTVDYFPRNFFIPRIAFRDLAISRKAVRFDKIIRVLDVGSGTGAVSLGIFELFSRGPLKEYSIYLLALDSSQAALERQARIRRESGLAFEGDQFLYKPVDLSEVALVERILSKYNDWDLIFAANFMTELSPDIQKKLFTVLSRHLTDRGSIIIAEPAQNRGRKVLSDISKLAQELNLTIFYPCFEDFACTKPQCWKWRKYSLGYIEPLEKEGKSITFSDKPLLISTLILNKHGATIFDPFREKFPDLNWGIIAPVKEFGSEYEICSLRLDDPMKTYKRGSIVGWKESNGKALIKQYRPL